jgi:hypothetical protein
MFLSKAERDYLTSNREFGDEYAYTIRSRLVKKIKQFANQELPILNENGYLTEFCKLTDNCKVQREGGSSLVRILPQTSGDMLELSNGYGAKDKRKEKKWAGGDSNSGPPPCQGGILTRLDHRPEVQSKNLLPKYML